MATKNEDVAAEIAFKLSLDRRKSLLNKYIEDLARDALPILVNLTPIDTGLARRSWKLVKKDSLGYIGYKLYNNQAYIGKLDRGWSRQAPEGMTKPFNEKMAKISTLKYTKHISVNYN